MNATQPAVLGPVSDRERPRVIGLPGVFGVIGGRARCHGREYAYCQSVDAFAWGVIGSVAGVVAAIAAIVGLIPLLRDRRDREEIPPLPGVSEDRAAPADGGDVPVVVGEIPHEPVAFQSRAGLLARLEDQGPGTQVTVVRAVTGMRGIGKTQLAAEYARVKLAERWRLVAWINAEEPTGVRTGLGKVAVALGLAANANVAEGLAVRHWLETDGDRCLLIFDNATDPAVLRPFIPAAGAARVIITSNEQSMSYLGRGLPVDVFTPEEALTFLAERTGLADAAGAGLVAAELGHLPLALAQAAAVIAGQRLGYGTYLGRLRAMSAGELLRAEEAGQYPRGVAAAVLLSVEDVHAHDNTGAGVAVMELAAVLSPGGVRREMIHLAGRQGMLGAVGQPSGLGADVVDRALARLAGASLLTFTVDGSAVIAHRLVMRVIREQLAARGALAGTCGAAAGLLDALAVALARPLGRDDRAAVQDLVEQIMALYSASAACPGDSALTFRLIELRWRAVELLYVQSGDTAQTIRITKSLLADQERVLGSDHPDTLATRGRLAAAYRYANTTEAITLGERNLADCERQLGSDHPETLRTRDDLADAYRAVGRVPEAIALHVRSLVDCERLPGSDHPGTLAVSDHLPKAADSDP